MQPRSVVISLCLLKGNDNLKLQVMTQHNWVYTFNLLSRSNDGRLDIGASHQNYENFFVKQILWNSMTKYTSAYETSYKLTGLSRPAYRALHVTAFTKAIAQSQWRACGHGEHVQGCLNSGIYLEHTRLIGVISNLYMRSLHSACYRLQSDFNRPKCCDLCVTHHNVMSTANMYVCCLEGKLVQCW